LTFHRLDAKTFLDLLAACRGFTSTAGFESVCEAAFLGKPISLVPTGKHVEQLCNAIDAARAGVAVWREDFHLSDFLEKLENWDYSALDDYRDWVRRAPEIFLRLLEGVARGEDGMRLKIAPQTDTY
jgi:UDP:flavonoid glycosyltransferase YjiC (YdhE family)